MICSFFCFAKKRAGILKIRTHYVVVRYVQRYFAAPLPQQMLPLECLFPHQSAKFRV